MEVYVWGNGANSDHRRLAAKNVKLIRSTLFNYVHTREELEHFSNELFQMMAQDHFKMQIHKVYPLEDVQQAHKVSPRWHDHSSMC